MLWVLRELTLSATRMVWFDHLKIHQRRVVMEMVYIAFLACSIGTVFDPCPWHRLTIWRRHRSPTTWPNISITTLTSSQTTMDLAITTPGIIGTRLGTCLITSRPLTRMAWQISGLTLHSLSLLITHLRINTQCKRIKNSSMVST